MVPQLLVAEEGLDGWQIDHQPPSSLTISSLEPETSQKDPAAPRKHCTHCHQCLRQARSFLPGNLSQQAGSRATTAEREVCRQHELWAPGSPLVTEARGVNWSLLTLSVYYSH